MSDTPETDAAVWMTGEPWDEQDEVVCSDFARKLERERDEARKLFERSKRARSHLNEVLDMKSHELRVAMERNAKLRSELAQLKGGAQ